jgi:hypothetical protein
MEDPLHMPLNRLVPMMEKMGFHFDKENFYNLIMEAVGPADVLPKEDFMKGDFSLSDIKNKIESLGWDEGEVMNFFERAGLKDAISMLMQKYMEYTSSGGHGGQGGFDPLHTPLATLVPKLMEMGVPFDQDYFFMRLNEALGPMAPSPEDFEHITLADIEQFVKSNGMDEDKVMEFFKDVGLYEPISMLMQ